VDSEALPSGWMASEPLALAIVATTTGEGGGGGGNRNASPVKHRWEKPVTIPRHEAGKL